MCSFILESIAKDLYTSLIHPHFNYGDIIYDACTQQDQAKLQIHQIIALRAIKNVEPRFPTQHLHEQTGIPWLDVERMERCSVEAFKVVHNMSSKNVNNMFTIAKSQRDT